MGLDMALQVGGELVYCTGGWLTSAILPFAQSLLVSDDAEPTHAVTGGAHVPRQGGGGRVEPRPGAPAPNQRPTQLDLITPVSATSSQLTQFPFLKACN